MQNSHHLAVLNSSLNTISLIILFGIQNIMLCISKVSTCIFFVLGSSVAFKQHWAYPQIWHKNLWHSQNCFQVFNTFKNFYWIIIPTLILCKYGDMVTSELNRKKCWKTYVPKKEKIIPMSIVYIYDFQPQTNIIKKNHTELHINWQRKRRCLSRKKQITEYFKLINFLYEYFTHVTSKASLFSNTKPSN